MRIAYNIGMVSTVRSAIDRWHAAVNDGDPAAAEATVTDPVVVLGPKGAGPIGAAEFADWIVRSGIKLGPRSWHRISDHLMVVEQDASWPGSHAPTGVATVFRVTGNRVSASLRLPDLDRAVDLARICHAMAVTESSEPAEPAVRDTSTPSDMGGPGQVLFTFVRHWARRWQRPGDDSTARHGRHVLVTEAVRSLAAKTPTVNDIAGEIGIDQSGASRLVADAVAAGYLTLGRCASDRRRRSVSITAAGTRLLRDAHRWQEAVFARLTTRWPARQRDEFHRAMRSLLDRSRMEHESTWLSRTR